MVSKASETLHRDVRPRTHATRPLPNNNTTQSSAATPQLTALDGQDCPQPLDFHVRDARARVGLHLGCCLVQQSGQEGVAADREGSLRRVRGFMGQLNTHVTPAGCTLCFSPWGRQAWGSRGLPAAPTRGRSGRSVFGRGVGGRVRCVTRCCARAWRECSLAPPL
jgi:hypothetical protein